MPSCDIVDEALTGVTERLQMDSNAFLSGLEVGGWGD